MTLSAYHVLETNVPFIFTMAVASVGRQQMQKCTYGVRQIEGEKEGAKEGRKEGSI